MLLQEPHGFEGYLAPLNRGLPVLGWDIAGDLEDGAWGGLGFGVGDLSGV